ncbi:hypothetical protein [Rhizobium wuzhouense]|uniref:Uncharacterized protein n=1 Tax=Rhizobium wuzhouense TaxID=1986026 RepID=A0ABX5NWN3_9HYPH|nr:hypothetical protein [Rhizobium wuzhouense]PYB77588.1 hypothetical protein DMY87_04350 [Rhizobium wuzhouense]
MEFVSIINNKYILSIICFVFAIAMLAAEKGVGKKTEPDTDQYKLLNKFRKIQLVQGSNWITKLIRENFFEIILKIIILFSGVAYSMAYGKYGWDKLALVVAVLLILALINKYLKREGLQLALIKGFLGAVALYLVILSVVYATS